MSQNWEYTELNQRNIQQEQQARAYEESKLKTAQSQGYVPDRSGYSGNSGAGRLSGPPRKLLSKALLITVPLGLLLYFLPRNGKDVQIPVEVHFFFAAVIAALGSPKLRRLAIGIVIIVVIFFAAVTVFTNHTVLHH